MIDRADRIEKRGSKFVVLSKAGEKLGEHDTREAAERQLAAVEASKEREGGVHLPKRDSAEVWRWDTGDFRLDKAEPTPEGWRRVPGVIGRADVVLAYRNADGSIRREFRPASEVFAPESIESFTGVPVTNDHPPIHLDTRSAQQFTEGSVATPDREGSLLVAPVLLTNDRVIADVEAGKRQLSPGYRITFDATPGVFRGQRYDGVQRNIRGNHVAVVDRGRQGPDVQLRMDSGDAVAITEEEAAMAGDKNDDDNDKVVTVKLGGQEIKTDAVTAAVIAEIETERVAKLAEAEQARKDSDAKLEALQAKVDSLTADPAPDPKPDIEARLDAREAAHKAELEAVQAKAREDLAEMEARLDVVATAKSMIPDFAPRTRVDGSDVAKSRIDVMHEVIGHVLGDEAKAKVTERSDAGYTQAFYEQALAAHAKRKDHGARILRIARGAGHEARKDEAGEAMRAADERRRSKALGQNGAK